jgi:SAM-dependent methyltransferase
MFSIETLHQIRGWELSCIEGHFFPGARVLEIGAGTGQQALDLSRRGYAVEAVELADSAYKGARVFPVTEYDGAAIPFADRSFDFVFSSNVLEHVTELSRLHAETVRILKPGGRIIHIVPTQWWRFWTTLSTFPAAMQCVRTIPNYLFPRRAVAFRHVVAGWRVAFDRVWWAIAQERHGIRGNVLTETWYFRPGFWRKNFRGNGFLIEEEYPTGLFYTGNFVMGGRLTIERRKQMAHYLGSACRVFVLSPATALEHGGPTVPIDVAAE